MKSALTTTSRTLRRNASPGSGWWPRAVAATAPRERREAAAPSRRAVRVAGFGGLETSSREGSAAKVYRGNDGTGSRDRIELAIELSASRWQSGTPVGRDRGTAGST